jgi:hypothetical protein
LLGEANREAPVGTEPHPTRSLALPVPGLLRQPAPYLDAGLGDVEIGDGIWRLYGVAERVTSNCDWSGRRKVAGGHKIFLRGIRVFA